MLPCSSCKVHSRKLVLLMLLEWVKTVTENRRVPSVFQCNTMPTTIRYESGHIPLDDIYANDMKQASESRNICLKTE